MNTVTATASCLQCNNNSHRSNNHNNSGRCRRNNNLPPIYLKARIFHQPGSQANPLIQAQSTWLIALSTAAGSQPLSTAGSPLNHSTTHLPGSQPNPLPGLQPNPLPS
jgi:hypothetical protein